jgi:hypothetical protein
VTYVLSFIFFAVIRAAVTGHPFLGEVRPITGRCISSTSSS